VGGVLLSAGLFTVYKAVVMRIKKTGRNLSQCFAEKFS